MYAVAIGSIQLSWLNILFMLRHKPVYLFSEITAIYSTHPTAAIAIGTFTCQKLANVRGF